MEKNTEIEIYKKALYMAARSIMALKGIYPGTDGDDEDENVLARVNTFVEVAREIYRRDMMLSRQQ